MLIILRNQFMIIWRFVKFFYLNDLGEKILSMMQTDNKYKLFLIGAIGTFMATLDGSIVNVALPTISSDFGCTVDKIAWVALSYSLTLISLMLIFGVWSGKKGYAFSYRFGYIFLVLGSLICSLSVTFPVLILGRIVQATGSAMFAAIGPGMVTTVFPENERGKGIGMMVMMVSAGFMVGPPLGGLLLTFFPWQSVFAINIPIGILGLLLTFKYFKKFQQKLSDKKLRLKSAMAISTALVSLTFLLTMIKNHKVYDFDLIGVGLITLTAFVLFLKFESKEKSAMIGLYIFKNRQFVVSVIAMLFMFISLAGVLLLVPFYLEQVKNFPPQQVGYFLIIIPVMMFIFAPTSGKLSDKFGYRLLTCSGILILMTGLYLLSQLSPESDKIYIILCLALTGMGVGIFNTPNSSALMGSVTKELRAVTSSILATTRNIGISLGVALSTTLFIYFQILFT